MKKNYYAKVLALTVAASMVSVPAFAAEDAAPAAQEQGKEGENELKVEKIEEKESEDVAEKGTVEEQKISTYSVKNEEETEITAAGGNLASGTYKLTADVTLTDANLTVPADAEVTIDLKGHVLTGNGNGSVITVNGSLILNDSDSTAENEGAVDTAGIWHYNGTEGTPVTLTGGVITGGNANTGDAPNGCGGGVNVLSTGDFVMNGGNIAGCKVSLNGGAVYGYAGGKFTMNGGNLCYNTANHQGGAVMIGGSSEMVMTGGTISNNICPSGGGVIVNNLFTMTGGKIVNNTATFPEGSTNYKPISGGGLLVNGGNVTITGGEISGNKAVSKTVIEDGAEKEYKATGAGIRQNGTLTLSGDVVVKDNICDDTTQNIFVQKGRVISLEGLGSAANIGFTLEGESGIATKGYTTGDEGKIHSDTDSSLISAEEDGELWYNAQAGKADNAEDAVAKVGNTYYSNFDWLISNMATKTAKIELLKDITLTKAISTPIASTLEITAKKPVTIRCKAMETTENGYILVNKGTALKLSGKITLDGQNDDMEKVANTRAIYVNGGAEFEIAGEAKITNFNIANNTDINIGGAIYAAKGAVTTISENATMSGNRAKKGGAVYNYKGVVNINGGFIKENTAMNGGGIYNYGPDAVLNINDGEISGNKAADDDNAEKKERSYGGGVVNEAGAKATMNGGKIANNVVIPRQDVYGNARGGGVYNDATFTFNGGEIIGNSCKQDPEVTYMTNTLYCAGLYNSKELTINGGTIAGNYYAFNEGDGNKLSFDGVGVSNNGGTLTITNGTISGNYCENGDANGVGLAVTSNSQNDATLIMTGGTICGNNGGTKSGAGLYLGGSGKHTVTADISGGKIVDNTGANGVSFDSWVTLNLSGNPVITGNKTTTGEEKDVYLPNNAALTLKDALTAGATIKVTGEGSVVANGTDKYIVTDADAAYFAHNGDKLVQKDATENQLVLAEKEEGKTYSTVTLKLPNHVKADRALTAQVADNGAYEVTLTAETGYKISSVTVGEEKKTLVDGKLTLDSISEDTTITVTEEEKAAPTLTLSANSGSYRINRGPATFTYEYNGDGAVTVSSSDENVATATVSNGTVTVTLKSVGTAKITVSATEGENYNAATATYDLTVQKKKSSSSSSATTTDKDKDNNKTTDNDKTTDNNQTKDDNSTAEKSKVIKLQIGSRIVNVDNEAVIYDAAPVIRNDRTLVPIRIVTETLGGKVDWNGVTKEVTLHIDGKEIKMTVGKTLEKYGVAPVIIDGRTFVPVRFVADELGATIAWDDATKTVTITKIEK